MKKHLHANQIADRVFGLPSDQERIGRKEKVFKVWKFRTMTVDAPQQQAKLEQQHQSIDGIMSKLQHEPCITPIGNLLRRNSGYATNCFSRSRCILSREYI